MSCPCSVLVLEHCAWPILLCLSQCNSRNILGIWHDAKVTLPGSVEGPTLTDGVLEDVMIRDHEVAWDDSSPLLTCHKSEGVSLRPKPAPCVKQVVLEVRTEFDLASHAVVALRELASIACHQRLLQVVSLD